MEVQNIKLYQLRNNSGQVEGLPNNPRLIKDDRFRKLVKSLQDDPEMLSLRELIVFPHKDTFVVIGGNMRLKALRELGYTEAPCKVLPADTHIEKLKAIALKDNSSFGDYDYEALANEWDAQLLADCDRV
jgi:ParB-like chromosome segregation protein Spo0J